MHVSNPEGQHKISANMFWMQRDSFVGKNISQIAPQDACGGTVITMRFDYWPIILVAYRSDRVVSVCTDSAGQASGAQSGKGSSKAGSRLEQLALLDAKLIMLMLGCVAMYH